MVDYIKGIDISKHQGDVDHRQVAQSGMRFCYCKATEGRDYQDPKFEQNIIRIRDVLKQGHIYYPGAYHFARPDTDGGNAQDGRAEAENFCNHLEKVCGTILEKFLPPALDFEKYSESDQDENIPWIEAWIETVTKRLGRKPIIYTGANVWRYEVGNTDKFIGYPLWQVYYSGTAEAPPKTPWASWALWQFSGGKSYQNHPEVPGAGVVDVDRFKGSLDDLKSFANDREVDTLSTIKQIWERHRAQGLPWEGLAAQIAKRFKDENTAVSSSDTAFLIGTLIDGDISVAERKEAFQTITLVVDFALSDVLKDVLMTSLSGAPTKIPGSASY